MRKYLCKVFAFLLALASQIIDLVASTLIKIGQAAVEVLGEVASSAWDVLTSNPLVLIGGGVLLWWLLGKSDDRQQSNSLTAGSLAS